MLDHYIHRSMALRRRRQYGEHGRDNNRECLHLVFSPESAFNYSFHEYRKNRSGANRSRIFYLRNPRRTERGGSMFLVSIEDAAASCALASRLQSSGFTSTCL